MWQVPRKTRAHKSHDSARMPIKGPEQTIIGKSNEAKKWQGELSRGSRRKLLTSHHHTVSWRNTAESLCRSRDNIHLASAQMPRIYCIVVPIHVWELLRWLTYAIYRALGTQTTAQKSCHMRKIHHTISGPTRSKRSSVADLLGT